MSCTFRLSKLRAAKVQASSTFEKEGFVQTEEGWTLGLPERLLFDFDKSEVNPNHRNELVRLSNQLNKYGLHKLKVVGYTDNIGNTDYNIKLSQARAQSVATILLSKVLCVAIFKLLVVVLLSRYYQTPPKQIVQQIDA